MSVFECDLNEEAAAGPFSNPLPQHPPRLLLFLHQSTPASTQFENIASALVRPSNFDSAVSYTNAFLIVYEVLLGVQLLFSLFGLPFAK